MYNWSNIYREVATSSCKEKTQPLKMVDNNSYGYLPNTCKKPISLVPPTKSRYYAISTLKTYSCCLYNVECMQPQIQIILKWNTILVTAKECVLKSKDLLLLLPDKVSWLNWISNLIKNFIIGILRGKL